MSQGRLLLTGCDGFIGQHIVRAARAAGWRTSGVSRSPLRAAGLAEVDERHQVDLLAPAAEERVANAMEGVDAVIHAAARVQLHGRPGPVIRDNVRSTRAVLGAATRAGLPRLIFLSSASVLFEPRDQVRLREDATPPTRCLNGYAESKKQCESLVLDYGGSAAIFRPQAVIGPGDRTLIPPILEAARAGRWRWIGAQNAASTDLLSVGNLAEYCLRAASREDATGVFHLSDGEVVPIETLLRRAFQLASIEVGEGRLSRTAAMALAYLIERPMRWLAPKVDPPLSPFGVEVLTRTRTLDRTRTCAYLGDPKDDLWQGLRSAIDAIRSPSTTP